jgi:hypothetical protein
MVVSCTELHLVQYRACNTPCHSLRFLHSTGDEQEYLGKEEQRTFSRPDEDRRPKLFAGLKVFVNR